MKCKACGDSITPGAKFCDCGQPVPGAQQASSKGKTPSHSSSAAPRRSASGTPVKSARPATPTAKKPAGSPAHPVKKAAQPVQDELPLRSSSSRLLPPMPPLPSQQAPAKQTAVRSTGKPGVKPTAKPAVVPKKQTPPPPPSSTIMYGSHPYKAFDDDEDMEEELFDEIEEDVELPTERKKKKVGLITSLTGLGLGSMQIDVDKYHYRYGETIRGELILDLKTPVKGSKLSVSLIGTQKIRFKTKTHDGDINTKKENHLVYHYTEELGDVQQYSSKTWHFTLEIPDRSKPMTVMLSGMPMGTASGFDSHFMVEDKAPIVWFIRGELEIPWKIPIKKKIEIEVED